ncbi:single-stranded DNA-binding protein [Psychrobacillus sp. FSL H8-0484]|uniref:single-stranded DNA-binding protein n=1 Tax=Psychrobacillus sp. FSL H8-0484 TaxID=2921390 RepID=UPI0030FC6ECC
MQSFTAVGRLTKVPVLTYGNQARVTFTIVVDSRNGTFVSTDYIPCVAWRELAELIANYTVKGQRIGIKGALRSRPYQDSVRYEVEVYEVEFYDAPAKTSN